MTSEDTSNTPQIQLLTWSVIIGRTKITGIEGTMKKYLNGNWIIAK